MISLFSVLIAFLVILFIKQLIGRYRWMHYFKRQGVPGDKINIVFGTSLIVKRMGPPEAVKYWRKKYGRTFTYVQFGRPTLLTTDPELVEKVWIKEFNGFRDRHPEDMFCEYSRKGILCVQGENWKRQRTIISPAFTTAKLKQVSKTVNEKINNCILELEKYTEIPEGVDMYDYYKRLTLDVIGTCGLAIDINSVSKPKEAKTLTDAIAEAIHGSPVSLLSIIFPNYTKYINKIFPSASFIRIPESLIQIAKRVYEKRKQSTTRINDVLQFMLDASQNEGKLSEDEVIMNMLSTLVGGFDTTSTALTFTTFLLAHFPEKQDELYREIKENIEDLDNITYDEVVKLPYLNQVWKEGLRMYPPISAFIHRMVNKENWIKGIHIPVGSRITTSPMLLHYDPEFWPEPEQFRPERFAPENKQFIKPCSYVPFGEGPRNCIGKRFAEIEGKMTLAKFAGNFKFERAKETPSHPAKIVQDLITIIPPDHKLMLKISKR